MQRSEVFDEKMSGLEQKIDAMHSSLESRVAAIEKRLNIESGDQQSVSVVGSGRDGEHLSVLVEVIYYAHTLFIIIISFTTQVVENKKRIT